jgi:hypothetical protein
MYKVIDPEYPKLDVYLCYICGFHADSILIDQKKMYQIYQQLYARNSDLLKPKKLFEPRLRQPKKTTKDNTTSDQQNRILGSVDSEGVLNGC